ncbi:hypothetical protein LSAT2_019789 [Lamellibrachia satsuma]|nr:hypothetical protein LSAT2_019789 [Lamellibrachia satsuma]
MSEGLTDKTESKDNMLIEVFCEYLLELQIKREIKRLVRIDPNISFGALRSEAIQLEEDGLSGPHRSVHVREVHEYRHASDDSSPLELIAAQLELLATTQSEIVSFLQAQQQTAAGWLRGGCGVAARPSRPEHFIVSIAGEGVRPRIRVEASKRYTLYRLTLRCSCVRGEVRYPCNAVWSSSAIYIWPKCGSKCASAPGSTGKLIHPVAERQAGGRSSTDCVLVDAIVVLYLLKRPSCLRLMNLAYESINYAIVRAVKPYFMFT